MRKSKYDEVIPSKQINENNKQSSEIDKRIELSSEIKTSINKSTPLRNLARNLMH